MQTEQYFLSEIVLPFCKNVLHIGYWHAGHSLAVQQTIIYLRVNPVSDSEPDMRSSDQDLVNHHDLASSKPEHFPRAPGLTPCHHPVPDVRLPTAKCLDANLL